MSNSERTNKKPENISQPIREETKILDAVRRPMGSTESIQTRSGEKRLKEREKVYNEKERKYASMTKDLKESEEQYTCIVLERHERMFDDEPESEAKAKDISDLQKQETFLETHISNLRRDLGPLRDDLKILREERKIQKYKDKFSQLLAPSQEGKRAEMPSSVRNRNGLMPESVLGAIVEEP